MARDVHWGILGAGFISGLFAQDLARTPGTRCLAVASRDGEKAKAFAETHGIEKHFAGYEALASEPKIDIVYVATPHSHHFRHAKMMLEAGKSVMVEKPFTLNTREAEDLIALAGSRKLFLMEAMWTLCNPLMRKLMGRVHAGDIGVPRFFSAHIGPIGIPVGHRVEDPALGASYIRECLVYPISILAALAPKLPDAADLHATAVTNAAGVDMSATLSLSSATGTATMSGGFAVGAQGMGTSGFQLIGDAGWLQVDNVFNPGSGTASFRNGPPETFEDVACSERYRWEIEEANHCILSGKTESSLVTHAHTLATSRLIDRARASAKLDRTS